MGCCGSKTGQPTRAEPAAVDTADSSGGLPPQVGGPAEDEVVEDGRVLNRFELVRLVGQGTFGKVFLARTADGTPPGRVAVKQMDMMYLRKKMRGRPRDAPGSGADEMVQREIATMKKLDHPNVQHLIDVINDDSTSTMFVVTDYLEGGTHLAPPRPL
jgi:serine/threonine protein kinase